MRKKGMLTAVAAFAASPQGRRLLQQGKDYLRSPEGRRKVGQLRAQVARKRPGSDPAAR